MLFYQKSFFLNLLKRIFPLNDIFQIRIFNKQLHFINQDPQIFEITQITVSFSCLSNIIVD